MTAKKSKIKSVAAPDLPSNAAAAAGAGRPAETSSGDNTRIAGSPRKATADKPRVVENTYAHRIFQRLSEKWGNDRKLTKGIANLGSKG